MPEPDPHSSFNNLSALDVQSGNAAIDSRLNVDQMLSLIDSILPFEACLYHEIIPLSVESSCLHLGMVNPSDTVATEYARKQVSFIHCSVVSWPVASDWQRKMLSKYLSHASRQKAKPQPQVEALPQAQNQGDEFLTFIVDSPEDLSSDRPTSTVDSSEELQSDPTPVVDSLQEPQSDPTPVVDSPQEPQSDPTPVVDSPQEPQSDPTPVVDSPQEPQSDRPASDLPPAPPQPPGIELEPQPLALTLDPILSQVPLNQLHRLPPPKLTQALLYQVLTEGIGRLYLERRAANGQVLWSRDGVVQAALKNLSLDQVQSVINELKRLTHLPLLPTAQPKQADIERLYKGERVLLRLRLMSGTHGEEATLQVLRGAALKFYQQQQIKQMGEDALGVAQTLQKRIFEIRQRARQSLTIEPPSARTLEALSQLLKMMEEQIEQIMKSSTDPDSEA